MILPQFLLPPEQDRRAYAHLLGLVRAPGSKAFARSYAEGLVEWQSEREPRMRRTKWCLAHLHTVDELEEMVMTRLADYGLDDLPAQPTEANGAYEKDADACDVLLYSELNLSYGERMGVERYSDREAAKDAAADHERSTVYSDGDGGYYVVYDADPRD